MKRRARCLVSLLAAALAAPAWAAAPKRPSPARVKKLPPPKPITGPLGRFMRLLDVTLGESTLHDAQARVGPGQARDNGGTGPAAVTAVCYAARDGTALAFLAGRPDGVIAEYQLAAREALLDYSGTPGHEVDAAHRPPCSPSKKLRPMAAPAAGLLRLGMSRLEVLRALGKPYSRSPKRLHYRAEFRSAPAPGGGGQAAGTTTIRFVELELAGDRVVRIWAGQSAG